VTAIEVHATPYGSPALELLAGQLDRIKRGESLAPVSVVVPSNYAAVSVRRSLAGRKGGVANVSMLTMFRLAERLGGRVLAASGRRPVSTPVIGQAVRDVLSSQPGMFAPVAHHPTTELALISAVRELGSLPEDLLQSVASGGSRAEEVIRVAREVRARLSGDWYDEHDLMRAATSALRRNGHDSPVVVHLPQALTRAGADLLLALAAQQTVTVNVGLSGDQHADRPLLQSLALAGIEVATPPFRRPVATRAVSVSDPDEEVRAALREITAWMRSGLRLGRIAVLYASGDPYARILQEQLDACRLPHNGAPVRSVGEMMSGRTLRALMALPDRAFRRSEVMGVITSSALRDDRDHVPSRAWERISRAAGVGGGDDWDRRLSAYASDLDRVAGEAEREEEEARARHYRLDADRARRLSAWVARLRSDVGAVSSSNSWADMAVSARRLLDRYLGPPEGRAGWGDEELRASHRVEEILERLSNLDTIAGPPPTVDTFRRALDGELQSTLGRSGRFGDGILTGPVSMAIGLDLDAVVVLGLAEGSLPRTYLEDSLLPDDERRAAGGLLPLSEDRLHHDHRHLLAAVASARESVFTFPRGDLRRHGDRAASRWLLDDAAEVHGGSPIFTRDLQRLSDTWMSAVASFASGLRATAFPSSAQDLRLGLMMADPQSVVSTDPIVRRGSELLRARRGDGFSRFDGNLTGCDLPDYCAPGQVTSATRLQAWAECPHAFLMQYLLGVEAVEDPGRRLEMSPLDRGSLVHEILDTFVKEQIHDGREGPWTGGSLGRLHQIADEACDRYESMGLTGRGIFWGRDRSRIHADLDRFAEQDRYRPVVTEVKFDDVAFPLPDGRAVGFRGAIDRLDRTTEGWIRVVDYKTGKADSYRGLRPSAPHDGGRHLQLPVYGVAAAEITGEGHVEAGYWFVTSKGRFDWVGFPIDEQVRRSSGEAIATIVDSIGAGVFPKRPPAKPSYLWVDCWYCTPDGLSGAEARRDWQRKRMRPGLLEYARMAEPEDFDAPT
jgi:hypothetical protein